MPQRKIAIVLFNLGGPDKPESVKPFLVNLFKDPAILRVPFFVRPLLARLIAGLRVKPATANYAILGGKSPLLELTEEQARALERLMPGARCFVAMRYWHPFSLEAARAVRDWDPDEVVLLPLYPHYSTTTTGSSLTAWRDAAAAGRARQADHDAVLLPLRSRPSCAATAAMVRRAYDAARAALPPETRLRVLFSAHGLPEVIIKAGDPYQFQVERTVAGVVRSLALPGLDYAVCYQSRATPQKWIGPSTEAEIERAGHDKVAVLVVPIAFVSEHSETLVELDVEYRELAEKAGVPGYFRAPAQNSDPGFIAALADLVGAALGRGPGLCSFAGRRTCPRRIGDCPHARAGAPPGPVENAGRPWPKRRELGRPNCRSASSSSTATASWSTAKARPTAPSPRRSPSSAGRWTKPRARAASSAISSSDIAAVVEAHLGRPLPAGWVEHAARPPHRGARERVEPMPGAADALARHRGARPALPRRLQLSSHEEMQVKFAPHRA